MAQDLAAGDSRDKRAMAGTYSFTVRSKDSYLCATGIDPSDYPSWTRELCITATIPSGPLLVQGVCARDMGNGCARTWVTPKRHAEPPAGGGQDALAGGYPDVVARGVCAVGAASGSEQARAVPALRDRAEDRLQVADALRAGGRERSRRSLEAAPAQSCTHRG